MNTKVLLILCDGMRADAVEQCAHPYFRKMQADGAWTMKASTVMPSITLPCHVSLFCSVDPSRHGILGNTYTEQVRPVRGLCEQLSGVGKSCVFFYNWEELRDLTCPGSLIHAHYDSGISLGFETASEQCAAAAIDYLPQYQPDFTFLYLGFPDEAGHKYGWMTDEYLYSVKKCWELIEKVCTVLPEEYQVIVTADHGGHDRIHGADIPEDMTIPVLASGSCFAGRGELPPVNIKDIAPTVAALLGVAADKEWEGTRFL